MLAFKQTALFVLLFVSGRAAAALSSCVTSCLDAAAEAAGCTSFNSVECICTSEAFVEYAEPCVDANCDASDQEAAYESYESTCNAYLSSLVGSGPTIGGGLSSSLGGGLSSGLPSGTGLSSIGLSSHAATATGGAASPFATSSSTATNAANGGSPTLVVNGASRIAGSGLDLVVIAGLAPVALWMVL